MTAYVDESLRLGGDGLYVLAAVVVPDARADDVRAALRAQLRRGQRRFHFRKQGDAGRAAMCDADLIRYARRAGWVSERVRYGFAAPDAECLLWLPDVVAGVTRLRADGDGALFEAVGDRVTVVAVPGHA